MSSNKSHLQKQLEYQKFLHAIDYVRKESASIKKLTTTELSRTNLFITNSAQIPDFEPWRLEAVEVAIPGGKIHQMNVHSNPIARARELLGSALQMSGNGEGLEAASYLYTHLVLEHLFKQANRRTAVAAALWILLISGYDCNAEELLAIEIGDLRQASDLEALYQKIKKVVRKV